MYLDTDVKAGIEPDTTAAEKMSSGLVPLVFLVNLLVFGLLLAYSFLNLLPDLPAAHTVHPQTYVLGAVAMGVLAPAAASVIFLWPVFARLQRKTNGATGTRCEIPPAVVKRIASAPLALAAFTFIGWLCMSGFVAASATFGKLDVPLDHVAHFVSRPVLAGLIAATATFFCRRTFLPYPRLAQPIGDHDDCRESTSVEGASLAPPGCSVAGYWCPAFERRGAHDACTDQRH